MNRHATPGSFTPGPHMAEIGRSGMVVAQDGHAKRRWAKFSEKYPGLTVPAMREIYSGGWHAGDRNGYRRGLRDAQKTHGAALAEGVNGPCLVPAPRGV